MIERNLPPVCSALKYKAEQTANISSASGSIEVPLTCDNGNITRQRVYLERTESKMSHRLPRRISFLVTCEYLIPAVHDLLAYKDSIVGVCRNKGRNVAPVPGIHLHVQHRRDLRFSIGRA